MKEKTRKEVIITATMVLIFIIVAPPLLLHTSTYPLAVVSGNSMYPTLKNGEIVLFSLNGVNVNDIPNGTIIVFVQTETGLPIFASMTAHPVIHEVIGRVVNQYGKVYYTTKGVNNLYADPQLLPAQNVLGEYYLGIPYAGYALMYLSSPGGLIFLIGLITIIYVSTIEINFNQLRQRQKFMGDLATQVSAGILDEARFREIERVVIYAESFGNLDDPALKDLNLLARKGKINKCKPIRKEGLLIIDTGDERITINGAAQGKTASFQHIPG
ncbi:MAG: signal peptidase I [Conexivisphaerales archaeon]